MSNLKLITFDLDNTLWPVDEVIHHAEKTCSDWIADNHPDAAAALSAERVRAVRTALLKEKPQYLDNLTALRQDAMRRAVMEHGFNEADARAVLEQLAGHYVLGALTNGNADLKLIGIDDLFAFHHSAETIGKRKPAPDMFAAALRDADVSPSQAMHIGDHPLEDVHAAREHGMHAVWANLVEMDWPVELERPRHHILALDEIPGLAASFDK